MFNLFNPEGENITEKINTGEIVTNSLAILLIVFFAGTWNAKKKAEKIPLQEILKAYRE